jgi:hypothetical protein
VSGGTESAAVTFSPPCFMTIGKRLFHCRLGEEGLIFVSVLSLRSMSAVSYLVYLKTYLGQVELRKAMYSNL